MQVDKPTPEELDTFLKNLPHDELTRLIITRAHCDNRVPVEFVCRVTGARCGIDNDGMKLAVYEQGLRAKAVFDKLGKTVAEETSMPLKDLFGSRPFVGTVRPYDRLEDFPIISESIKDSSGGFDSLDGCVTFNEPGIAITDKHRLPSRGPIAVGLDVVPSEHFYVERDLRLGVDPRKRSTTTERFEKFVKELPVHELFELGDLVVGNIDRSGLGSYRSLALEQEERVYRSDLQFIYDEIKSRFKAISRVK